MPGPGPSPDARAKLLRLVSEGVPVTTASRIAGVSKTTGHRIVAASDLPFSGGPQPPANTPPIAWDNDQPRPPGQVAFRAGYHDHSYRASYAPVAFEGFTIERVRNAVTQHRLGFFYESSLLACTILTFPPVLAALGQRIAPALALPRMIKAGERGLARILGAAVESQVAPRDGLLPSPYLPPTLWGTMGVDLAFMGFSILQHAYGEPDPETGIRMVYTRRWPTWATMCPRYRETFQAITDSGPVDIISGDGKFTLVADSDEPHLLGSIVALGEEALDGKSTQRARAQWIDRYSDPKLVGVLPPNVPVGGKDGDAFFEALRVIRGPDGFGAIPNGSKLEWTAMQATQSTAIKDALESNAMMVAMGLLGSDGTLSTGTGGVYTPPMYEGVARRHVDRDLKAMVRAINQGHIKPWLDINYAASIAGAAGWKSPVLDIPLPDPDADARMKSYAERCASLVAQVVAERAAGFPPTQERVDVLAKALAVAAPTLGALPLEMWLAEQKIAAPDEVRATRGLAALPDGAGTAETLAAERAAGRDRVGSSGAAKTSGGWGDKGAGAAPVDPTPT